MDQSRLDCLEEHLTSTLLTWGVGSTVLGSVLWVAGWRAGRRELVRFGRQTAIWGATDVAIAVVGARHRRRRGDLDQAEVETKARTLQITLALNGLADVVYVAGGARVWSRTSPRPERPVSAASVERESGDRPAPIDVGGVVDGVAGAGTYLGMGRGDGAAIIIQGAFLLALDCVYALRVSRALRQELPSATSRADKWDITRP